MSDPVAEIIHRESQDLGRPCELIDAAVLAHNVVAVVYRPEPFEYEGMDTKAHEIRTATYVDGHPKYSTIVKTWWAA